MNLFQFEGLFVFSFSDTLSSVGGGSTGAPRVLKDVNAVVLTLFHELDRLAEIVVVSPGNPTMMSLVNAKRRLEF